MKKILLIASILLSIPLYSAESHEKFLLENSFHDEIRGDKFWYALKIDFLEQTEVNVSVNSYLSSRKDGNLSRATFLMIAFYEPGKGYSVEIVAPNSYPSAKEYYFQINLLSINFSRYHILNASGWMEVWTGGYAIYTLSPGTYYFVIASYAAKANVSFWINSTGKASFSSPTKGNKTFFYERHHFSGNLNIGWGRGLLMLDGRKNINADAMLFAVFEPRIEEGISLISYTTPSGKNMQSFEIYHNGFPIYRKDRGGFNHIILEGESGKWAFGASMISLSLTPIIPNLYLYGADVELPE